MRNRVLLSSVVVLTETQAFQSGLKVILYETIVRSNVSRLPESASDCKPIAS